MPNSPHATPEAPVTIRHDRIWGYYANVTRDQAQKIARYFLSSDDELCLNEKTASRLHAPGLDFLVFPEQHRAELLRAFAESHSPLRAAPAVEETPPPCQPSVLQFLSAPEPQHPVLKTPPDYYRHTYGITSADIPELTRLYKDPEIIFAEGVEDAPVRWTRIHIQRALVELRAPAAARLMLEEIRGAGEDAYMYIITTDAAELISTLGADAYGTILAMIEEYRDEPQFCWEILPRLADIVQKSAPENREHCIGMMERRLRDHPVNDPYHNALLVTALCDLKAVEAAPLIEQAYANDHVELEYYGDWEDAQIGLGLKTKRDHAPAPLGKNYPFEAIPHRNTAPKVGRNDSCPCGSGKKYKKCCMDKTT